MEASQDAIIALLGTIFGGAGLEIVRRALAKSKEREDSATLLRNELRTELTGLKTEMQAVEKELDLWRQKYYELFEQYLAIKMQYEAALKVLAQQGKELEDYVLPQTPLDKGPVPPVVSDDTNKPDKS